MVILAYQETVAQDYNIPFLEHQLTTRVAVEAVLLGLIVATEVVVSEEQEYRTQ
jgi:hypothetical protein